MTTHMQTAAKNLWSKCFCTDFHEKLEKTIKWRDETFVWRLNRTTQAVNHPHLWLIIINADFQCIFMFNSLWKNDTQSAVRRGGGCISNRRVTFKSHLNISNLQENNVIVAIWASFLPSEVSLKSVHGPGPAGMKLHLFRSPCRCMPRTDTSH